MKIFRKDSNQKRISHRYVWGAPRLDLQEFPKMHVVREDNATTDLTSSEGTANSVSLETEEYGNQVLRVVGEQAADTGLKEERENNKRTPGNPMGILFGSQFERQWINPVFWTRLTLFSKDSILKNISHSAPQVKEMMDDSVFLNTGVRAALYNETGKKTLQAIAEGGNKSLENASYDTFAVQAPAVLRLFDQVLEDVRIEEKLGQDALNKREPFRVLRDISLWRSARHRGMLNVIKKNVQKARNEVEANINRAKEHLLRQRANVENDIATYQTGMRNRNDSVAEKQFWSFVQGVIQNPESFLEGRFHGMVEIKKAFGTTNKVKILDAIKHKFADQVVELERSQQLTLDQDALLQNMDSREQMTKEALETTNFERLYKALQNSKVQTYEGEQIESDENKILQILVRGLRRLGVDIQRDVYLGAPVRITTSERLVLILKFVSTHQELLVDQNCPLEFKRTLYTWLQETKASQEKDLRQGSEAETGSVEQRRYILRNALVVRNAARDAFGSFQNIAEAMRSQNPREIDDSFQKIQTFLESFQNFFGADGKSGALKDLIGAMPEDEKDILLSIEYFKNAYAQLKETLPKLQEQRQKYVDEVLKKLPPSDELLEAERREAREITESMREMLSRTEGTIVFDQQKYTAMQAARSEIFTRVKEWDDAKQDLENRHFNLPGTEALFSGMMEVGNGIEEALEGLREGVPAEEVVRVNSFDGLMRQRMQNVLQMERTSQFEQKLSANMTYQMDTLLNRKEAEDGTKQVFNVPQPGMTLDRLEVVDVTNTDGKIDLPESLQTRTVLEDLTLLRSGAKRSSEDGTMSSVDMVFHNDQYIVQIYEEAEGKVRAKAWEKPEIIRRDKNAVIRVPHTQEDMNFVVLNMSAGGTKASTQAHTGLRLVR